MVTVHTILGGEGGVVASVKNAYVSITWSERHCQWNWQTDTTYDMVSSQQPSATEAQPLLSQHRRGLGGSGAAT